MAQQEQNNRIRGIDIKNDYQIQISYSDIVDQPQNNQRDSSNQSTIEFELENGINVYFAKITQQEFLQLSRNMCTALLAFEMMKQCCQQNQFNQPDSILTIRLEYHLLYIHFKYKFEYAQSIIDFDIQFNKKEIGDAAFQRIHNKFLSQDQKIKRALELESQDQRQKELEEQMQMGLSKAQEDISNLKQHIKKQNQDINQQQQQISDNKLIITQQAQEIQKLRTEFNKFKRLDQIIRKRSLELYGFEIIDQDSEIQQWG